MTVGAVSARLQREGFRRPDGAPLPEWRIRRSFDSATSAGEIRGMRAGLYRMVRPSDYDRLVEALVREGYLVRPSRTRSRK